MTMARINSAAITPIMIRFGIEIEMNPQLKYAAGPVRDIASKTIVSPLESEFSDTCVNTLLH